MTDPSFQTTFLPSVVTFTCALSRSSSCTCSLTYALLLPFSCSANPFSLCVLCTFACSFSHICPQMATQLCTSLSYAALVTWRGGKVVRQQNVFQYSELAFWCVSFSTAEQDSVTCEIFHCACLRFVGWFLMSWLYDSAVNQKECMLQSLLCQVGNFTIVKKPSASYFRNEGSIWPSYLWGLRTTTYSSILEETFETSA